MNWQKIRNPRRAEAEKKYGCDTKHAMHLVRLLRMGTEILRNGVVRVRRPDAEELGAIRDGAWTFEAVESFAAAQADEMDETSKTYPLPRAVDTSFWSELCTKLLRRELFV